MTVVHFLQRAMLVSAILVQRGQILNCAIKDNMPQFSIHLVLVEESLFKLGNRKNQHKGKTVASSKTEIINGDQDRYL